MSESHRYVQCPFPPLCCSISMPVVLNRGQDARVLAQSHFTSPCSDAAHAFLQKLALGLSRDLKIRSFTSVGWGSNDSVLRSLLCWNPEQVQTTIDHHEPKHSTDQRKRKVHKTNRVFPVMTFSQNYLETQSLIKNGPFSYSVIFGVWRIIY